MIDVEMTQEDRSRISEAAKMLANDVSTNFKTVILPRLMIEKANKEEYIKEHPTKRVSAVAKFMVSRVPNGVRVIISGLPESEEVIPEQTLKDSVNRAAYAYTEKHCGPRSVVGNKGGGLYNKIRAIWR
jgi:hypothetical protein